MLASCFVLEPVEDAVDEAAVVLVVAVSGAEVTTFEATVVMVAVFEEAVGAADVTICCAGAGADVAVVDGGVAVVMVEF